MQFSRILDWNFSEIELLSSPRVSCKTPRTALRDCQDFSGPFLTQRRVSEPLGGLGIVSVVNRKVYKVSFESRTPAFTKGQTKKISVVVPVRNEITTIADTLYQLLDQDFETDDFEILVVDGQSTDGTPDVVRQIAREHDSIRLLENPKLLSSAARNIGIHSSDGDIVLIVDAHCEIPTRTYFTDLVDAFEQSGAACLGRPQPLDVTGATLLQRAIAVARSAPLGHFPGSYVYTDQEVDCPAISVAVAYRRSVFKKVGDFDERFDACEDCDLNYRIDKASLRCHFVPKLRVKYQPRNSIRGLFKQMYRYGRGRVRLMRKYPHSFQISSKLPTVLFAFIAAPLICWTMPFLLPSYIAAMALYVTIVSTISIWESIRKRDTKLLLWLPAVFVAIHAGAGTGMVVETFTGWGNKS